MSLVLDTCALLYWTHQPERLSQRAATALARLDNHDRGLVCAATFWEIALKVRAGRLELGMSPAEYCARVQRLPVSIEAVDAHLWLASVALEWSHQDPIDRLVVALAQRHEARISTSDRVIRGWFDQIAW